MTKAFEFNIGDKVAHVAHTKVHDGWMGVVIAREFYENPTGGGQWFYVRWVDPHGKINDDSMRMSSLELTKVR